MDKYFVDTKGDVIEYDGPDRRKHVRFPVCLSVNYSGFGEQCVDFILNISRGGVFIKTDSPLEPGSRTSMQFNIPPKIRFLGRYEGEVVRTSDEPGRPKGMFIRFINVTGEELDRLEDFLEGNRHLLDEKV